MPRDIAILLVGIGLLALLVGAAIGFLLGWIQAKNKYLPSILFHFDDLIIMQIALSFSKPMPFEEKFVIGILVGLTVLLGGLEVLSYIPIFGINEAVASLEIACTTLPRQCWPMKH